MNKPMSVWYCDLCGNPIEDVDEGYVVWRTDENGGTYDFKIIHQVKCDNHDHPQSISLGTLLGNDGLAFLLTFLSIGRVKKNFGETSSRHPQNIDDFVDFIHRVQTPYYEEARRVFSNRDYLEDHDDDNEWGPYCQDSLKRAIKHCES